MVKQNNVHSTGKIEGQFGMSNKIISINFPMS